MYTYSLDTMEDKLNWIFDMIYINTYTYICILVFLAA